MNVHFAHLTANLMNAHGAKKEGGQPFSPDDLLLRWKREEDVEATPEALMALMNRTRGV